MANEGDMGLYGVAMLIIFLLHVNFVNLCGCFASTYHCVKAGFYFLGVGSWG